MIKSHLEYLSAREQLMENIDSIVDENFLEMFGWENVDKWDYHKDKLNRVLCDAVCKHFPVTAQDSIQSCWIPKPTNPES